ncbi:MAG TPA: dienelactone hydrolase family protein, partial [Verrucomicrobiae bacterium]|nr:dienelactone hydrolase family protein [Verrucomicrobiae bacterium]
MRAPLILAFGLAFVTTTLCAQPPDTVPGAMPLTMDGDLSAQMVAGINRFLRRETGASVTNRARYWQRDLASREAYEKSVQTNRDHFRQYIGAVDPRPAIKALDFTEDTVTGAKIVETDDYTAMAVRWPAVDGVFGEGLLIQPKTKVRALVVLLPDADQTPEALLAAPPGQPGAVSQLAASGCLIVIPELINRQDTFSGNPALNRFTNQPHREWIYRQAFEMGRHVIGYEVQKVLAVVDWFQRIGGDGKFKVGVAGYGEGGLIALYSAALDLRVHAALVSGYFGPREHLWQEPIYRNVWGLLDEFGDAEIASLVAPRPLVVEHCEFPQVSGPPAPRNGRNGAAPGKIVTIPLADVRGEVTRAAKFFPDSGPLQWSPNLVTGTDAALPAPNSSGALRAFLAGLSVTNLVTPATPGIALQRGAVVEERQRREVRGMEDFTQHLLVTSDRARAKFFWDKLKPGADWEQQTGPFKDKFWNDVIGRFPAASLPANPRARKIKETPEWTAYEVVLDVWPDVYAWGYLLLPNDLKPGERRPVVVCQHGLEGVPNDTAVGP